MLGAGLLEASNVKLAFSGVGVKSLCCVGGGLSFLSEMTIFGGVGSDMLVLTGGVAEEGGGSGIRGGMEVGREESDSFSAPTRLMFL